MRRILPTDIHQDVANHCQKILKSYTTSHSIHQRITAFLTYREMRNYLQVSRELRTSHAFVRTWCMRACEELMNWDPAQSNEEKRDRLMKTFSDLPRSGGKLVYTSELQCLVIAAALKQPSECQREITHWTHIELADELRKSGQVPGISKSTVGRTLKSVDLRPHKSRYWLTPKIDDQEAFEKRVENICQTYHQASDTDRCGDEKWISVDEKTGIQALERINPIKHAKPAQIERREFEYKRHGTLCLTPSFNVATGQIDAYTIDETRTEKDFAEHINKTVATAPELNWVFVLDQLNTHKSESLVRWVAGWCKTDLELGEKGKSGILKDMSSRMAFLEETSHRVRFLFTPKHCSWLNQVEIWFSILARKLLNRGNFASKDELRSKLERFISYFNEKLAKPFAWTYSGKILRV